MYKHKDFDRWNIKKKQIHAQENATFYHEREIWWCSIGINVGFEQDGTGKNFDRPVIIIRGFNKNVFLGLALIGKKKKGNYYFHLGNVDGREATAVLSQIRLIDSKRLVRKIKTLDRDLFKKLQKALIEILFQIPDLK